MLKKALTICTILCLMFTTTGCSFFDKSDSSESTKTEERPFTESKGLIKYFTVEGVKVCLPETVGEYVKYLEKFAERVELGDTGKTVEENTLMANGVSSMVAYLKVYLEDGDWQWFGIRYENNTDEDLPVSECEVTQITLDYDTVNREENHHYLDSFVFITKDDVEYEMNGKFTDYDMFGAPYQYTDGHRFYKDDEGYVYELVSENLKAILTRVEITYPEK